MFSSAYIVYKIVTKPMNWSVNRRFNDFAWLRDTLQKLNPAILVLIKYNKN